MAIHEIRLVLSAYYPGGRPIEPDAFVAGLGVDVAPYTPYGTAGQWRTVGLQIASVRISDFKDFGVERYEEYEKSVQKELRAFARWLATIPAENMKRLQADGLVVYLLVTLLMDRRPGRRAGGPAPRSGPAGGRLL